MVCMCMQFTAENIMSSSMEPCLKTELIQGRPLQLGQLVLCKAAAARLGVQMEADTLHVPFHVSKSHDTPECQLGCNSRCCTLNMASLYFTLPGSSTCSAQSYSSPD